MTLLSKNFDTRPLGLPPGSRSKGPLVRFARFCKHLPKSIWQWLHKQAAPLQSMSALLAALAIGYGVLSYVLEEPHRIKQRHYEAWQLINSAQGQKGSGGRIDALQDLNNDRVDLTGLDVSGATLMGIDLSNARLDGSNFRECDLTESKFRHTWLQSSDFRGAVLWAAHMQGADLRGANMERAGILFSNLEGAFLGEANLQGAAFANSLLKYVIFTEANLSNANLHDADLSYAKFDLANMNGANLQNAILFETDFRGAKNLTIAQLRLAKSWEHAKYDDDMREKLGLTTK